MLTITDLIDEKRAALSEAKARAAADKAAASFAPGDADTAARSARSTRTVVELEEALAGLRRVRDELDMEQRESLVVFHRGTPEFDQLRSPR